MSNTYNIPSLTAGKAINYLTELYTAAYIGNTLTFLPSVSLLGPMGVGKSTLVQKVAKNLSKELHIPVYVTDIRLINFAPVDLRGIPTADMNKEFSIWLKPKIFDLPEEGINILFLDEISAAPQSLQASAYQIALDKQIGEHKLPDNCIVICAGNRTTDKSVAFRMPKALANRLMHFEIQADFDSWYGWAVENAIDPRVTGYLAFDNRKLNMEPQMEELAFPTPRSWEFVSRLLTTTGKEPMEIHDLLCGCIGVSNAVEFEAWCNVYRHLPSMSEILSGKSTKPVKGADAAYAVIASLLSCIVQKGENVTELELENACRYVGQFPADFSAMFFRGLLQMHGMNLKLVKVSAFVAWMKKNKNFL